MAGTAVCLLSCVCVCSSHHVGRARATQEGDRLAAALDIRVSEASVEAATAVIDAGGSLSLVYYNALGLRALLKPEKWTAIGKPLPRFVRAWGCRGGMTAVPCAVSASGRCGGQAVGHHVCARADHPSLSPWLSPSHLVWAILRLNPLCIGRRAPHLPLCRPRNAGTAAPQVGLDVRVAHA